MPILQIGQHQWGTELGYDQLEKISQWKWPEIPIVGSTPLLHYAGKESPSITFEGTYFNYAAVGDRVESLEALGDAAVPHSVTGENGRFYGFFVVTNLRRLEETFRFGQESAPKNRYSLTLKYYGGTPDTPFVPPAPSLESNQTSAVNAQKSISSALSPTQKDLETVADAASDPQLADLQNADGFTRLAAQSRRNARTLSIPAPEADSLYDLDPADSGFFQSIEGVKDFLDHRRDTQRDIATVGNNIRKLPGYNTLRNVPALQSVETSLRNTHSALDNVSSVQRAVNDVLRVKGFLSKTAFADVP